MVDLIWLDFMIPIFAVMIGVLFGFLLAALLRANKDE